MTEKFNPNDTMISRVNKQIHSPLIQLSMIGTIIGATITGSFFISDIKASVQQARAMDAANHMAAMEAIEHEKDMRMITSNNVNENVDEVKEDVKALAEQQKEDARETQRLLRELIQKQGN